MEHLISIIIPAYNTALLIERTLRSVLEQCGPYRVEVFVVDDCSTDETLKVVEGISDSRIRVLKQLENKGPAAARNRGLHEARGEYCAFLDGDDFWDVDFLQETVSFLDEHPDCVAVSVGQCHKIIGKEQSFVPQQSEYSAPIQLPDFYDFWARYNHVCTGSVLMRTAVALETGGQREDLRICEDLEYWALLATYGPWGFIPKTLFTSDGGKVTRKQGWVEKNMRRWQSAPSVDNWGSRIKDRFVCDLPEGFRRVLGRIARNLCYSHIMANKFKLACSEVRQYGRLFPNNLVNRIFRVMASNSILWLVWCSFLKKREFSKRI